MGIDVRDEQTATPSRSGAGTVEMNFAAWLFVAIGILGVSFAAIWLYRKSRWRQAITERPWVVSLLDEDRPRQVSMDETSRG